ncbi:hypothetical protein GCM10009555_018130 [Acrocarpospora macrocephala]|uniref:Uncharacterized protein n=1 Tax=Acrocarpospora macrocephala TaxID=150177 RepID=A0A5M3WK91_9ACTN|nr:hypothetical protein [Acrocarpospora macrocephala]GES07473.1 hypothetical protein Amac_010680 [Acrocarpospora macrocephala]
MTATLIILALGAAFMIGGWSGYKAGKGDLDDVNALANDAETQVDDLIIERDQAQEGVRSAREQLDAAEQRAGRHLADLNLERADHAYLKAGHQHLLDQLALQLQAWEDKGTTGSIEAARDLRKVIYPPDVTAAIDTALAAEERIAAQIEGRSA